MINYSPSLAVAIILDDIDNHICCTKILQFNSTLKAYIYACIAKILLGILHYAFQIIIDSHYAMSLSNSCFTAAIYIQTSKCRHLHLFSANDHIQQNTRNSIQCDNEQNRKENN